MFAADAAHLLVFTFADVGEIAESMLVCCFNGFRGFSTAIGTDHFLAAFRNTGGLFYDLAGFPVVRLCLFKLAFGADTSMLGIAVLLPFAEVMITCILNADFTLTVADFIAGVGLFAAFGADFVFFVWMVGFNLGFIVVAASGVGRTAAGVIGGTEIEITDLAFTDHDAGAVIAGCAGIALNGVKIGALGVIHKTHMRKTLLKEEITLLRGVAFSVFIGKTKAAGACDTGSFQNAGGDAGFFGTPADKHTAPGRIGHTIPNTVLGVIVGSFPIAYLCQCNTDDIVSHVAGIGVCILICSTDRCRKEGNHKRDDQNQGDDRTDLLFEHSISSNEWLQCVTFCHNTIFVDRNQEIIRKNWKLSEILVGQIAYLVLDSRGTVTEKIYICQQISTKLMGMNFYTVCSYKGGE